MRSMPPGGARISSPFAGSLLLEQIEDNVTQHRQVLCAMVLVSPTAIFIKGHIQRPVQFALNQPSGNGHCPRSV
jgi:hypothetical protein